VKDGNVYSQPSYIAFGTNYEMAIADAYFVGKTIYPEQFADVDPTQKLDEITTFFLGAPLSADLAAQNCEFTKYDLTNL
jgi:iron complex transport system substrate-binding protein